MGADQTDMPPSIRSKLHAIKMKQEHYNGHHFTTPYPLLHSFMITARYTF